MSNIRPRGFTIVELLIVIVVIAILAAISVVAYNGIQSRSNNTAIANEASQAARLLKAFYAIRGQYPTITNGQDAVCIGTGFRDYDNNGVGDCWDADVPSAVRRGVDVNFNTELTTTIGAPSSNSKTPVYNSNDAANHVGPVYVLANNSSIPRSYPTVRYWQTGSSCPFGEKLWNNTPNNISQCGISLAP